MSLKKENIEADKPASAAAEASPARGSAQEKYKCLKKKTN